MFLDYVALGLLFFVVVTLFYAIIAIHDIPYEISKHRHHPHQDAIHVAGWVSLFTLHVLWPFLWIWAMMYRPDRGWGFGDRPAADSFEKVNIALARLEERLSRLEGADAKVTAPQARSPVAPQPAEDGPPRNGQEEAL